MSRASEDSQLHTYVANAMFKHALELLKSNPRLAERLSVGHQEVRYFLPRGPVGNESVLALACAKGYLHHNTLLDEGGLESKQKIALLIGGPKAGEEADFIDNFGEEFLLLSPEQRKAMVRVEVQKPEPNTCLRLLEVAAILKDRVFYSYLVDEMGADEGVSSYLGPSAKALMADPAVHLPRVGDVIDKLFELHESDASLDIGINTQDSLGNTPLHIACLRRDPMLIERLLAHGADPRIANAKGCTPVDILQNKARLYDYREALYTLAQYTGCCDRDVESGNRHTFTLQSEADWAACLEPCLQALAVKAVKPSAAGLFAVGESKTDATTVAEGPDVVGSTSTVVTSAP